MTPLARYLCSVVVRSQGWLAPVLVFAALCSVDVTIGGASTGNSLPTFATDAALLLPVAIWLTVVVGNCEDPVQAAITVVISSVFFGVSSVTEAAFWPRRRRVISSGVFA